MSRILGRRLFITFVALLIGLMLAWELRSIFPADLSPQAELLLSGLVLFLIIGTGLWLDSRLPADTKGHETPSVRRPSVFAQDNSRPPNLESELFQLNQELVSRSQEQSNELARLNVELQLQIAMHKKAEQMARVSEERFRNMADNIQEGLTIIENGRLVYRNERACEIFGDCPDTDLHNRIREFAAPEEHIRLEQIISQAERTGSFPKELEFWILRKDGQRRCIRERYSSNVIDDVHRTFIVTSDITDQVQAYQSLEQAVNERTRELSTMLDVSRRIASTLELEPLLNLILDQIQNVILFSGAAIFTLDDGKLQVAAYQIPQAMSQSQTISLSLENAGPYQPVIHEKKC